MKLRHAFRELIESKSTQLFGVTNSITNGMQT